jgi:hypothetical protein
MMHYEEHIIIKRPSRLPENNGYGLQSVGYGLQSVSYGLQSVGHRLRSVGYRLQSVGHRLEYIDAVQKYGNTGIYNFYFNMNTKIQLR